MTKEELIEEKPIIGRSETITIPHRPSSNFVSDFANGAVISGPTIDGLYFLTFFCDSAAITQETGILVESNDTNGMKEVTYQLGINDADIEHFREDKARITLSKETLASLRDLLNRQLS